MNEQLIKAFRVVHKITEAGGKAHIVGGALRDALLQRETGDVDIATSFTPEEVMKVFEKVIPVGIEHGTVIVRYQSESFEVTTYRTEEGYEDYRHPDKVAFVRSIEEDLARRDFTINAMAMDDTEKVIDPFCGQQDLNDKVIRAVGNAEERFKEDPLRMMRALRFCSQLEFKLEKATHEAMITQAHLLNYISTERIAAEFEKLMAGPGFKEALKICKNVELYRWFPIFKEEPGLIDQIPRVRLYSFAEVIAFYREFSSTFTSEWIKEWKLSNRVKRETVQLSEALSRFKIGEKLSWIVYKIPDSLIIPFSRLATALELTLSEEVLLEEHRKLSIQDRKELAFQAEDLLNVLNERDKGPWIGQLLEEIEYAVVTNQLVNSYQSIKEWAIKWNLPETD
ncbi:CCA tRNA nucleotidyltransferase [Halobacillus massiliensis]|uniref:CCA tRNA nucleotidyltransferase n=1 Tax=Halobacillus massiliensis TaxID=1926286 RepID=UPI0009E44E02|nr:CCA tRNA nucleotidyltransferase [Halobacillus massiliensis]